MPPKKSNIFFTKNKFPRSYRGSIKRITAVKSDNNFSISVLERKQTFRENFFRTYLQESRNDKHCEKEAANKLLNQPDTKQRSHTDKDMHPDICSPSSSEKSLSSSHSDVMIKTPRTSYLGVRYINSSRSPIATRTYMSIVKRAKHNIIVSPQNIQKMKMTKIASKKRYERNIERIMKKKMNKSIVLDSNYNFQQYSPKTCKMWQSILQQNKDQHLAKCNTNQNLNVSLPIEKSESTTKKFNMSSNYLKETNTKKCGKLNNVTKESKHLNPVVYLIQLSKGDIEKYTKSKKEILDPKATSIIQTPTLGTTKMHKGRNKRNLTLRRLLFRPVYSSYSSRHRKLNKRTLNERNVHLVHSTYSSELNIQKHRSPDKSITRLNPVVYLKRLSEFEIQKYVSSTNITANPKDLNPPFVVQKLLKCDIQKYETDNDKKVRSKSGLVSETIQLQNNDVSAYRCSKFEASNNANSSLNTIDLMTKSSCNDQSKPSIESCDDISLDNYSTNKLSKECSQTCLKRSDISKGSCSKNDVQQYIDNTVLSPDSKINVTSYDNDVHINNNKEKSGNINLLDYDDDEDDECVELIYNPEDI